jgi:hypothetical protein
VWVLKAATAADGVLDPQTICTRIVRNGKLQRYTSVRIQIASPRSTSQAPDGIFTFEGLTSGDGIAYIAGFHAGIPDAGAIITVTALFTTGEQATTTYRIQ